MKSAAQLLDDYFLEMRWRCLSLAADLDRIQRAPGGAEKIAGDPRTRDLQKAIRVLLDGSTNRAEQVQLIFSDKIRES